MSKQDQLPPISGYPNPEPGEANYIFVARAGFVGDRGDFWNPEQDICVEAPRIEFLNEKLSTIKNPTESKLSWIQFFQQAAIKVRHPERFEGDVPGPNKWAGGIQTTETIYGKLFPAASPQLVTGASEEGFTFATVSEIVAQGSITPFMEGWLKRYSVKDNTSGFNSFLIPLLPILDPKLGATIRNNKFSNHDFED